MTETAPKLFEDSELIPWLAEWQNMPEFVLDDLSPKYQVIVNFACEADVADFARLLGRPLQANDTARQMQSMWFPDQEIGRLINKRYIDVRKHEPALACVHSDEGQSRQAIDYSPLRQVADPVHDLYRGARDGRLF